MPSFTSQQSCMRPRELADCKNKSSKRHRARGVTEDSKERALWTALQCASFHVCCQHSSGVSEGAWKKNKQLKTPLAGRALHIGRPHQGKQRQKMNLKD